MVSERVTSMLQRRRVMRRGDATVQKTGPDHLRRELNQWLCERTVWNHDDWLQLLSDLRLKGYSDLVDTPKGQEVIGRYLETNHRGTKEPS